MMVKVVSTRLASPEAAALPGVPAGREAALEAAVRARRLANVVGSCESNGNGLLRNQRYQPGARTAWKCPGRVQIICCVRDAKVHAKIGWMLSVMA